MRLIDADALKKQVKELLDLAVKRVDDTPNNSPCYRMYVAQENERARLIDLIDKAPTVNAIPNKEGYKMYNKGYMSGYERGKEERPQGEQAERALAIIDRLRTDEHINNKECGTLRRAILLPERPTEINCSHCGYFKFSQSFIENVVKFMTEYKIESVEDLMKELDHINEWLGGRDNEAR